MILGAAGILRIGEAGKLAGSYPRLLFSGVPLDELLILGVTALLMSFTLTPSMPLPDLGGGVLLLIKP